MQKPQPAGLLARIKKALGGLGFLLSDRQIAEAEKEMAQEIARAPCIAILGEVGVGKSSTINALFNAGAKIDHVEPCTVRTCQYVALTERSGSHGPIRVFDVPGLGEHRDTDKEVVKEYARILPECDAALWILDAATRTLSLVQEALDALVASSAAALDRKRLVIGINKVDRMEPGNWNYRANLPSLDQEQNIKRRVDNVWQRLARPLGVKKSRIIAYSAKQHYDLEKLLNALMDACPKSRRWVLHSRADLASYEALVDPLILKQLKGARGDSGKP